jgi:glycosyltransferase involved in cell wall biosynthesis
LAFADREGVDFRLLIVDNASTDDTASVLERLKEQYGDWLITLYEPKPGGQFALNAAIPLCRAPVIAFFDDDERLDPSWLQVIRREFADPKTDFIAGPCKPLWNGTAPGWLPDGFGGVLGIIDNGAERARYSPAFKGMLTQGNCAVRGSIFEEVGPYPPELTTAEDRWLYGWLIENGKTGYYCPDFAIHHIMQETRLSKQYFRAWAAREGRDREACDRLAGGKSVLLAPWFWRSCAVDLMTIIRGIASNADGGAKAFAAELGLRQAWAQLIATLRAR